MEWTFILLQIKYKIISLFSKLLREKAYCLNQIAFDSMFSCLKSEENESWIPKKQSDIYNMS